MPRTPHAPLPPIVWERGSERAPSFLEPGGGRPGSGGDLACLWSAGFLANRSELAAAAGLDPAATDAQVLLALLGDRGLAAVERLAGPFSFVVWDAAAGRLIAARDRLGTSGIYYAEIGGALVLGDRVGPLRDRLSAPLRLNLRSLTAHLLGRAPHPGETCFEAIRALEPGAMLIATRGGLEVRGYWRIEPRPRLRLGSAVDYGDACRELLFRIAGEYLPRSPFALAMSSGMDSTSVAAALRHAAPDARIAAFTFADPELPPADETGYAALTARRLDLDLERFVTDRAWPLGGADGLRTSAETPLVAYQEGWEQLYRRLRERGLRVLFTGVSGDHLFGGTGVVVYPDLLLGGRWRELARQLGEHRRRSRQGLLRLLEAHLLRPLARAVLPRRRGAAGAALPWLGETALALARQPPSAAPGRRWMLPGRRLRLAALGDRMLSHGVTAIGQVAAGHGIELRHPLIDHRLVEFAAALPVERCWRAGVDKAVLRTAMRGILPDEVVDLGERILPLALFERGVRERERDKVWGLITGMRAAELGLVDERKLHDAYRRYLGGEGSSVLWHTLCVEDWLRRYA